MKICILSEYFYPDCTGGTGTILSQLVRRLQDDHADLEIDVITSKNLFRSDPAVSTPLAAREEWDGIQITRLSTPQPRKKSVKRRLAANMLFTAAAFRQLLSRGRAYDCVLVVTAPPTLPLAARLFSRLTGTPYVYLVYDLYLDMALAMNMVSAESKMVQKMRHVQRGWLRGSSKVIVLGRCMRDLIAERYDVATKQIEVVPIASNLGVITPQDKRTRFRAEHGLDGFVVLYAGNFAQYQDFDTLLDAAQNLNRQGRQDITFAFVGDGAKREYIRERIERDGLSNVRMFPFVPEDELCDLLSSADVSLVTLERGVAGLAVPSKFYNILASGRPTVAVMDAHSEVARVIEESHCGVRVDPENAGDLARALATLADEPQTVKRMGQQARRVCEAHYSLPHIASRFYSVFQEVARRSPSRPSLNPVKRPARHPVSATSVAPRCAASHSGHSGAMHRDERHEAAEVAVKMGQAYANEKAARNGLFSPLNEISSVSGVSRVSVTSSDVVTPG